MVNIIIKFFIFVFFSGETDLKEPELSTQYHVNLGIQIIYLINKQFNFGFNLFSGRR